MIEPIDLQDLAPHLGGRPPELRVSHDLAHGASGELAIDLRIRGTAVGGVRLLEETSPVSAAVLARTMTWKMALARIPTGGAKAIVTVPPGSSAQDRGRALDEFADRIADHVISGSWFPAPDMGVPPDVAARFLSRASGGTRRPRKSWWTSGPATAWSVRAAAAWGLRHQDRRMRSATIAIIGLGAVGSTLARLLTADGARVVAAATKDWAFADEQGLDVAALPAGWRSGTREVDVADILRLNVDLLLLCGPDLILQDSASVRAGVVASATNFPAAPQVQAALGDGDCLYLPPLLCNWGGAISGALETVRVPMAARRPMIAVSTALALTGSERRARRGGEAMTQEVLRRAEERALRSSRADG